MGALTVVRFVVVEAMGWGIGGQAFSQAPEAASTMPATAPADRAAARHRIQQIISTVTDLLLDRGISAQQRSQGLKAIMLERADMPAISRIMLGTPWDELPAGKRQEYVDVFSEYLMSVYVPLMTGYAGEQVQVTHDEPVGRGDHSVIVQVTDLKAGGRRVATIACRLRPRQQGWKVIDVTVEGISVAKVFGAQFRPVLAREGIDGLLGQLRRKMAEKAKS
jgi:phospholipid transport system substrate-binding protein